MSVEYVEGGLLVDWTRLPLTGAYPRFQVCPEELFQTAPLDLSVRRRHCAAKPEMATTGSESRPAFKKSILQRYSM